MTTKLIIVPQRSDGKGWAACSGEHARRFALQRVTISKIAGRVYRTTQLVAALPTWRAACIALDQAERAAQRGRRFTLGARCPTRLLASSLLAQGSKPRSR